MFEARGVPTVCITAAGFEHDYSRSAQNFGLPFAPLAMTPSTITNQPPDVIRSLIGDALDQIIHGLTHQIVDASPAETEKFLTMFEEDWLPFEGEDRLAAAQNMNARFLEYGWGDGFPLWPATTEALEKMLRGTTRSPDQVLAVLEPGFGKATIRKIAANAVMAGCKPEHLPVLIAALECMAEPRMNLRMKQMSTGPDAPMIVVNGPIRKTIGINSGRCALGPGGPSAVNTAIGRALRLCLMNIGLAYPGISDLDTIGTPLKYSMCVGENEEASPWDPYHVEHGFSRDVSTVTIQWTYGICELKDFRSTEPEALIEPWATAATNAANVPTGTWLSGRRADPRTGTEEQEHHVLLVAPDHAEIFRRAGWSKPRIRKELHKLARMPFRLMMIAKEPQTVEAAHPEMSWIWDAPETVLPVLEDADCYDIVVVGGPAGRGQFILGAGGPVTKPIDD
jgi:hypothetical protein